MENEICEICDLRFYLHKCTICEKKTCEKCGLSLNNQLLLLSIYAEILKSMSENKPVDEKIILNKNKIKGNVVCKKCR